MALPHGTEAVGQSPEERGMAGGERAIGRTEPGEEARELREGRGERGEGDHGEEEMPRVHVGTEETSLLALAHLSHALLEGGPPLRVAVHAPVGAAERLPFHETHPVPVAARGVEPEHQALRGIVRRRHRPQGTLAHLAGEDLPEEALLVAEVVIEHALVHPRPPRDAVHPGPREALVGELPERGGEDALARARGVAHHRLGAGTEEGERHELK